MPSTRLRAIVSWPLHPFLLAAHPVLSLLLVNVGKIPLGDIVWPLVLIEVGVLALLLIGRAITGNWRRAGMQALLIVVLLLFYQRFEAALKWLVGESFDAPVAMAMWTILIGLGWWLTRGRDLRVATLALNAATLVFLAVPLGIVTSVNIEHLQTRATTVAAINQPTPKLSLPTGGVAPDIWYIVLDRYARADVLQSHYDFDNSAFLGMLRQRGFQVLEQSAANYQRTSHSLASTLNLDYLDAAATVNGGQTSDWVGLYRALEDFKVWRALQPLGYSYSHFGSWWTPTAFNRFADRNINWKVTPTFQRFLWGHSLPGRIMQRAGWPGVDDRRIQCERVRHKFAKLNELAAAKSGPKFVFAHFLVPHPPFVLSAAGGCVDLKTARARSRRDNYIDQVRYTNDQLQRLVGHIQQQSKGRAIIILQADEGPWPARFAGDEHTLGLDTNPIRWTDLTDPELVEKMAILNAIYLPPGPDGKPVAELAATMTPVNTFRLIFRHWFNAELAPLADKNQIYLDGSRVLGFHDVTERLRKE